MSSFDFFVAALSTLSSVENGTFLLPPYTDDDEVYTKCSAFLLLSSPEWRQASRIL